MGPTLSTRVVVMGVSGSGKTTVGQALAGALGASYVEGDDLHPDAHVAKMRAGTPLDDADRWPWLDAVAAALVDPPVVATCSSLKRAYRDRIRRTAPDAYFVHLDGAPELLRSRQAGREGHFMPTTLMDSQLATLEPLGPDEAGTVLDVSADPTDVVRRAVLAISER